MRRIESSRANGARSRGPTTEEGKLRASENAMRHGLLAKCVVVPGESGELFEAMLGQHLERFEPADGVEFAMVEDLAAAYWRMRRAWAMETAMLGEALGEQPPEGTGAARLARAFRALAAEPGLGLLHRYEARLHRMYQRALGNLAALQSEAADQGVEEPGDAADLSRATEPEDTEENEKSADHGLHGAGRIVPKRVPA